MTTKTDTAVGTVTVTPVRSRRDWAAFSKVPFVVYASDRNWIPGDIADVGTMLRKPSEKTSGRMTSQAFLAYRGSTLVGRIAAIADLVFIAHYDEPTAYFGYFECLDDVEAAHALLDAAAEWATAKSLTTLVGPMSPSLLWSAGILVHGNDIPPLVGMPHNPPYYAELVESWGMTSIKEFHSFYHDDPHSLVQTKPFERKYAMGQRWKARSSVTIRPMNDATFDEDVEKLRVLYNSAFSSFWGFTPVEPDEIQELVATMRPILDREIVLFAELDGTVVGFVMGIPDVNKAALGAVRSRFGVLRDLHTIARWRGPGGRKHRSHVRLDMMFVDPECPDKGTSALLIFELFQRIHDRGYDSIEAAPVLADGGWFRSVRASYPVDPSRTYRIFSKTVRP
ncbi:hypothetical protein ASG56_19555 [Rhodococcus sp. Leaf7]|uniref:GNAT family N-acetyltransferase n=1 Tax=unclassified Rhodococcus (in: high G+C Gram-positive bacteria) TaxID=192944 RepID=UPI0006F37A31|nr:MULTISPECIES: hypothetical protein [unclassified Rhodococcus (in: high G+C Gram-positive bacteria)]KQU03008.1 hypothetical protein ASG56_19555 [Rhodococcus sp. Leaf7]KQU38808.1 hypothetical protein ASG64_17040 [Rhodococcus sp. Leaf247]